MAAPPWYRWFPADFANDTRHLSMLERGAYRDLLDSYYLRGKLRSDLASLYRICGAVMPDEQAAVKHVVAEFFMDGEAGFLKNPRADLEIAERLKYMESTSERGKKAAQARWGMHEASENDASSNASSIPQAMLADAHTHTHIHKQKTKPIEVEVPEWVPKEEWSAFVEMRRRGKSPFTDHAKKLALGELAKLREQGHDPKTVINAAVLNGWKSFYAPKASQQTDAPWKGAH